MFVSKEREHSWALLYPDHLIAFGNLNVISLNANPHFIATFDNFWQLLNVNLSNIVKRAVAG